MLGEMTLAQLEEWRWYAEIEPFGPLAEERRAGTIAATVANAAPFRGRAAKTWRASDFSTALAADRPRPTAAEVTEKIDTFFVSIGGVR
jgi:hypothetical protein